MLFDDFHNLNYKLETLPDVSSTARFPVSASHNSRKNKHKWCGLAVVPVRVEQYRENNMLFKLACVAHRLTSYALYKCAVNMKYFLLRVHR